MTHRDWANAMLAEPGDDVLRLAFADWLEEQGEAPRAEWVRLGVATSRAADTGERRRLDYLRREAFERCRPDYFVKITSVTERNHRGLVGLECEPSAAVLKRLKKADWLGRAVAEGWLAHIHLTWFRDYDATETRAAWSGGARGVPLRTMVNSMPKESTLNFLIGLPELAHLRINGDSGNDPAAARLAECQQLTELTLELYRLDDSGADRVLAAALHLPRLRRVTLVGHRGRTGARRPSVADVIALAALPSLRSVALEDCPHLRDADLAAIEAAAPGVAVVRTTPLVW